MNETQSESPLGDSLERQINAWRAHLQRSRSVTAADTAELEDHLREQIASLAERGLSDDEAFLVAVKRIGAIDDLTREFAREHSERLWKQLVLSGTDPDGAEIPDGRWGSTKMWVALALAAGAATAMKLPTFFGIELDPDQNAFYLVNTPFLVLPFIVAWFAWDRPLSGRARLGVPAVFIAAALAVNAFPFPGMSNGEIADTQVLSILHVPLLLWIVVGVAYVGGAWRASPRRMDFIRFTGELFIYYVLIALGGGVLIGLTFVLFEAIGIDVEPVVQSWILPGGIAGAAVVATWLVEAKQSVIENIAPVLARIFIPLFAAVLLVFVATMAITGRGHDVERDILIAVDLLLIVVFGLLLYATSARDPDAPVGPMDSMQLVLVGTALVVDALALWAIGARISEFGFTPNRLAALGMNLVLLGNLGGAGVLQTRFVRARSPFTRIWAWQMNYLYVIAVWGATVALLFPLIFGFA
ncbi:MAG: permease prefix domain 1-containing protein [Longimicrobiales bacterium]|nr:permease prefix domain 1-containing protein [Longimicrobiales bacterium]